MDKDSYLLELCRYVVLNPVRAGMVKSLRQWRWSSHRAMLGVESGPRWLLVEALLAQFARGLALARERYERFVAQGMPAKAPWDGVRGQIYLGDDRFVDRMQRKLGRQADDTPVGRIVRSGRKIRNQAGAKRNG